MGNSGKGSGLGRQEDDIILWFEERAENAGLAQTETLRCIIELNHGTEYLRRWLGEDLRLQDLNSAELEALYTSSVPLSTHADMEPYIRRIADGDTSPLLTSDPITTLSLSSGTTDGRPKYMPFTRFSAQTTLQIFRLAAAYRSRLFPIRSGGRVLEFIYSSKMMGTKGGLAVGTATSHYYASEEFMMKQRTTKSYTCCPQEVIAAGDYKQSTYCHLLLGLHFRDQVEFLTSTFAYSIVQALRTLEELWEELVEDIREGTVSTKRVSQPRMRKAVLEVLSRPDPSLAGRIEDKCRMLEKSGWREAIPQLWPHAKYIYSIMTGSMLPYLGKLRHYAGENVPLVAADYGSTESWIGVNVDPLCPPEEVTFAVIPTFSYFEFIPLQRGTTTLRGGTGDDQSVGLHACDDNHDFLEADPVPLAHVKIGQQYELVLTTFTGLYRYRLGDVVEVVGFYRGTPRLSFICRRKLILSVNIDKNTEKDLQVAVEAASLPLARVTGDGAELVDFTSHADVVVDEGGTSGHYVVYWEIRGEVEDEVLAQCCRDMDLAFADHGYVVSRKSGAIGALELRVVREGAFRKILDYFVGNGTTMGQFKTPRCIRDQVLLQILDRCTVRRFRSTAYL